MPDTAPKAGAVPEQVRVAPAALARAAQIAAERGVPADVPEPAPVETRKADSDG